MKFTKKYKFTALYIIILTGLIDFLLISVSSESLGTVISDRKSIVRVQTPASDAATVNNDDAVDDVICCWARDASSQQLQQTDDRYQPRQDDDCDDDIKT